MVAKLRLLTGQSVCNSAALDCALRELFGSADLRDFQHSAPYAFCTSYDVRSKKMVAHGNCPKDHQSSQAYSRSLQLWQAARATAAAPTFFEPFETSADTQAELVDGAVQANCPAKLGVQLAAEIQALGRKTHR